MKIIFPVFALFTAILILSCGGEKKQSQSNVTNSIDEETKFAQTLYGEKSTVLAKGELLNNGKPCAIAGVIRQKTDNNFWIEKASFFQKEGNDWKVLLKLEEKLTSPKGELTSQVEAKNGYIISFDTTKKPITINIVKIGRAHV